MYENKTYRRHAELFLNMAETQGVDLEEAALRAEVAPDELTDGVLRCIGCNEADACEHGLQSDAFADGVPDYCRNAEMFRTLTQKGFGRSS